MPNKAERDAWKEKLVNEAEQKILELTDSDKFKKYLDTLSKFHGYSQRNIDLIYSQDPAATQVAGYKQWQNDFKRHVNKGAKSIRISAPIIKKITEEEKKKLNTTEDKAIVGYRFIPIFDIKQTSGQHVLNTQDFIKENLQEHKNVTNLYNSFKDYLNEKTNLAVTEENISQPGVKGYFVPKANEVVIDNKEQDSALKLKTLYHEYAHSQLHGLTSEFKDRPREYKETQAEAVAYVAMQNIGVDTSDYSLGYVATWAKDKDLIHKAISEIQKVSNKTIDLTAELTEKLQLDQKQEQQQEQTQTQKAPEPKTKEVNANQEQIDKLKQAIAETQDQLTRYGKIIEKAPKTYEAGLAEEEISKLEPRLAQQTLMLNSLYGEDYKLQESNATLANPTIKAENNTKQPNLSDQYKALHDKLEKPGENKNQIQEQLNKVKTEISQKTQQQLKDFAKANPDLKQPRIKKEQQTLQR